MHEQHLEEIEDDPDLSTEYGINYKSILLELNYFDMCSGGLVQDAMHDLLEGILQYEIKLLLVHYIRNRKFTLDSLNSAIESIELSSNIESDRPTVISKKKLFSDGNLLNQKGMYI